MARKGYSKLLVVLCLKDNFQLHHIFCEIRVVHLVMKIYTSYADANRASINVLGQSNTRFKSMLLKQ